MVGGREEVLGAEPMYLRSNLGFVSVSPSP